MSQIGFFLYTGDWVKDTRVLSATARGCWADALCFLNEHEGTVTWPISAFANYWIVSLEIAKEVLEELRVSGVAEVEYFEAPENTCPNKGLTKTNNLLTKLSNRRMTREISKRLELKEKRSAAGKKGMASRYQNTNKTNTLLNPSLKNKNKTFPIDALSVANLLAEFILKNNPKGTQIKESQINSWAEEADRMERIDKHTYEEIRAVLEWSQKNPFWKRNILSMGKLREKWNILSGQMLDRKNNRPMGTFVG